MAGKPGKTYDGQFLGEDGSDPGFFDIQNAEDACRVFGTAHGDYLRDVYERLRRGEPEGQPDGNRRSWGASIWRLNNTWPMIYMSVVDYYLEPKFPYYFLKRSCESLAGKRYPKPLMRIPGRDDPGPKDSGLVRFGEFCQSARFL